MAQPTRATVVVSVPADARLFVDGQLANLTSSSRTFSTPHLQPGQDYYYTIKAEAERNGQLVARTQRVIVQAGKVARVDFGELPAPAIAQPEKGATPAPSRVTVRLPEDARLYIDGVSCPLTSGTRTFDTPRLQPGRQYAYTLKAEVRREGQARSESRRIVVEAGKQVRVDFGDLAPLQAVQR